MMDGKNSATSPRASMPGAERVSGSNGDSDDEASRRFDERARRKAASSIFPKETLQGRRESVEEPPDVASTGLSSFVTRSITSATEPGAFQASARDVSAAERLKQSSSTPGATHISPVSDASARSLDQRVRRKVAASISADRRESVQEPPDVTAPEMMGSLTPSAASGAMPGAFQASARDVSTAESLKQSSSTPGATHIGPIGDASARHLDERVRRKVAASMSAPTGGRRESIEEPPDVIGPGLMDSSTSGSVTIPGAYHDSSQGVSSAELRKRSSPTPGATLFTPGSDASARHLDERVRRKVATSMGAPTADRRESVEEPPDVTGLGIIGSLGSSATSEAMGSIASHGAHEISAQASPGEAEAIRNFDERLHQKIATSPSASQRSALDRNEDAPRGEAEAIRRFDKMLQQKIAESSGPSQRSAHDHSDHAAPGNAEAVSRFDERLRQKMSSSSRHGQRDVSTLSRLGAHEASANDMSYAERLKSSHSLGSSPGAKQASAKDVSYTEQLKSSYASVETDVVSGRRESVDQPPELGGGAFATSMRDAGAIERTQNNATVLVTSGESIAPPPIVVDRSLGRSAAVSASQEAMVSESQYAFAPVYHEKPSGVDDDKEKKRSQRRRCAFVAVTVLACIGIAVGLGVALSGGGGDSSNGDNLQAPPAPTSPESDTELPSAAPSDAPMDLDFCFSSSDLNQSSRFTAIREVLLSTTFSDNDDFSTASSPQRKALCWISYEDAVDATDIMTVTQRYVLAVLFYAVGPGGLTDWISPNFECDWEGLECADGTTVTSMDLRDSFLEGILPEEIGNLDGLERLVLAHNNIDGTLPATLDNLSNLEWINVQNNRIDGGLDVLVNITSLVYLVVTFNTLKETIPTEIGSLTNLVTFHAGDCLLEGSIPTEIGRLQELEQLSLDLNELDSSIPTELGNLANLVILELHVNSLNDTIPAELGNLTKLATLRLHRNDITGVVPEEVCRLRNSSLTVLTTDCEDDAVVCDCCTACNNAG